MAEKFKTTEELAEFLRTPVGTVRYWRSAGLGPRGFRVGRRVLYDEAEIERWLREQIAEQADR